MSNPFSIHKYPGPSKFCDRNSELSALIEAFDNKRACVIYSMRRLGKTGLIHHFQHHLNKKKKAINVYFDILDTSSDNDFVAKMVTACLNAIDKKSGNLLDKISKYFSKLRPVLTFDPITGAPEIELILRTKREVQLSLSILCEILGEQKEQIQIAIDEFQQIANYDNTVIDASLRSYFHKMDNVHFIFSGSQRHLLLNLFSSSKKPLFGTVQHLQLKKIESEVYQDFIKKQFKKDGRIITEESILEVLRWTRTHTFYTQFLCNRLYAKEKKMYTLKDVDQVKNEILIEYEISFLSQKRLLSPNQWALLKGIAHENGISSITTEFLRTYGLAGSTARQALEVMVDKEIVYDSIENKSPFYEIYDPFFARWIEKLSV